jgi:hypothetical protein
MREKFVLFEGIPSDENSDTSCNESDDDKDYCLPCCPIAISESFSVTGYGDKNFLDLDSKNIFYYLHY